MTTPHPTPRLPLAVLHDHLDGGARPETLLELAAELGHPMPAETPHALAAWFAAAANTDLDAYLATFEHIMPMLQTQDALRRIAYETVLDLAADSVVYAEQRFAPEEHLTAGLPLDAVVEAVQDGFAAGMRDARTPDGHPVVVNTILCALRTEPHSRDIASLAVRRRRSDPRLVGFDLAGAERGAPASDHAQALRIAREGGVSLTVHAGEETGPDHVADALTHGAQRIGHGVSLIEEFTDDGAPGPVGAEVLRRGVCLELAPTSNVQTGAARSLADHPLARLLRAGLPVTVNPDNRLVSGITVSSEFHAVAAAQGLTPQEQHRICRTAVLAGFGDPQERHRILHTVIDPAWTAHLASAPRTSGR
ncbi:adenosine deaminase [Streptomyces sp. SID3343]|uniref:adenosine deaminase n=1 Tax=Streptomyces sp. SID3343 TaxID=2690260 RepID=UPI00136ED265|nr:adenosine deaminase [Streptomyces sp. SID3343]